MRTDLSRFLRYSMQCGTLADCYICFRAVIRLVVIASGLTIRIGVSAGCFREAGDIIRSNARWSEQCTIGRGSDPRLQTLALRLGASYRRSWSVEGHFG